MNCYSHVVCSYIKYIHTHIPPQSIQEHDHYHFWYIGNVISVILLLCYQFFFYSLMHLILFLFFPFYYAYFFLFIYLRTDNIMYIFCNIYVNKNLEKRKHFMFSILQYIEYFSAFVM